MSATISPQTPHSPSTDPEHAFLVSVVIPCLNEEENIVAVVTQALEAISDAGITGEVVIADNNSTDRSAELGAQAGALGRERLAVEVQPRLQGGALAVAVRRVHPPAHHGELGHAGPPAPVGSGAVPGSWRRKA